ncbi:hypothetical protein BKA70DRAFT_1220701 [Coprinopsis sp. MPI-PUGE-AT-0042]|nr:hypothetical protein BKA70DRAFT_1220701 [Coprinopsis sp. MPI-PUGE-AT-0042]
MYDGLLEAGEHSGWCIVAGEVATASFSFRASRVKDQPFKANSMEDQGREAKRRIVDRTNYAWTFESSDTRAKKYKLTKRIRPGSVSKWTNQWSVYISLYLELAPNEWIDRRRREGLYSYLLGPQPDDVATPPRSRDRFRQNFADYPLPLLPQTCSVDQQTHLFVVPKIRKFEPELGAPSRRRVQSSSRCISSLKTLNFHYPICPLYQLYSLPDRLRFPLKLAPLNFICPKIFTDYADLDAFLRSNRGGEESEDYKSRTVKIDIEKSFLRKIDVDLSNMQSKRSVLEKWQEGGRDEAHEHCMQLRKITRHPYLFDGKRDILDKAARQYEGSCVLSFSQMSRVLDIMEDCWLFRQHTCLKYWPIDGETAHEKRTASSTTTPTMYRARGSSDNLTTGDIVVVYDSSWYTFLPFFRALLPYPLQPGVLTIRGIGVPKPIYKRWVNIVQARQSNSTYMGWLRKARWRAAYYTRPTVKTAANKRQREPLKLYTISLSTWSQVSLLMYFKDTLRASKKDNEPELPQKQVGTQNSYDSTASHYPSRGPALDWRHPRNSKRNARVLSGSLTPALEAYGWDEGVEFNMKEIRNKAPDMARHYYAALRMGILTRFPESAHIKARLEEGQARHSKCQPRETPHREGRVCGMQCQSLSLTTGQPRANTKGTKCKVRDDGDYTWWSLCVNVPTP